MNIFQNGELIETVEQSLVKEEVVNDPESGQDEEEEGEKDDLEEDEQEIEDNPEELKDGFPPQNLYTGDSV